MKYSELPVDELKALAQKYAKELQECNAMIKRSVYSIMLEDERKHYTKKLDAVLMELKTRLK